MEEDKLTIEDILYEIQDAVTNYLEDPAAVNAKKVAFLCALTDELTDLYLQENPVNNDRIDVI
jgi:5'-3' exonuclease